MLADGERAILARRGVAGHGELPLVDHGLLHADAGAAVRLVQQGVHGDLDCLLPAAAELQVVLLVLECEAAGDAAHLGRLLRRRGVLQYLEEQLLHLGGELLGGHGPTPEKWC